LTTLLSSLHGFYFKGKQLWYAKDKGEYKTSNKSRVYFRAVEFGSVRVLELITKLTTPHHEHEHYRKEIGNVRQGIVEHKFIDDIFRF